MIVAGFVVWKYARNGKKSGAQARFTLETLELARAQFEIFNIKLRKSESKNGLAAILHEARKNELRMEVGDYVPDEWKDAEVEVFFKVIRDDDPVFYVFSSSVTQLNPDYEASSLTLRTPENLRVEKKRHFSRVIPDKNDTLSIGLWPLSPGKRLPRTSDEMGAPLLMQKKGMKEEILRLANISGAGLGLIIRGQEEDAAYFGRGKQLVCKVAYNINNKYAVFWCTGEIMNSREFDDKGTPARFVGLEFTNWGSLDEGGGEIHWSHSSPLRGAKPMLQWAGYIENRKRK